MALVQSVTLLLGGFTGPLVGWRIDRFGPRRFFPACGLLAVAEAVSVAALLLMWRVWTPVLLR